VKHKLYIGDGKQVLYAEAHLHRPIVSLDTKECPLCSAVIRLCRDGTMRCNRCWWYQGIAEAIGSIVSESEEK